MNFSNIIKPKWRRGIKSSLDNTPITDGNILVTTDTEELYIDIDGKRVDVSRCIIKNTKTELLLTENPKNKIYFAKDTLGFYYFKNNEFKRINGTGNSIPSDSTLSEYGIISGRKRYIQGMDPVVQPYLYEYDTTYCTDLNSIHIDDDIYVKVYDSYIKTKQTNILLPTDVTIGTNFYINCDLDGNLTLETTRKDSNVSTCIGGFHYGRVRKSRTINDVVVGIVPNSIWTLRWCPDCKSPDAMVYLGNRLWGDIYLTRVKKAATDADGIGAEVHDSSAYGALPCTGSENFCQFTFTECLSKVGKRLPMNDEFVAAADGSPIGLDNANTNAWSATSNTSRATCGTVANAISFFNVVDLVGNVWKWNADKYELNNPNLAYSWHTVSDVKGDVYGPGSYGLGALLSGGAWGVGSRGGSRCVGVDSWPWRVHVGIGAWAVARAK